MGNLLFGSRCVVTTNSGETYETIYVSQLPQGLHLCVHPEDVKRFEIGGELEYVRVVCKKNVKPISKQQIDWSKVPRDIQVFVSDDGDSYRTAYFCCALNPCVDKPFVVFNKIQGGENYDVKGGEATSLLAFRFCEFPNSTEIPDNWLLKNR